VNGEVTKVAFNLPGTGNGFQLGSGINSIRNKLPQKDLMIRVQEFFDDWKNIFGLYRYVAFGHNSLIFNA
jgi:hypothetical protein